MRQLQARINPNCIPLSRLSMDLKVMPRSHKGHKFILCISNEVTNYIITIPIYQAKSEEIGQGLIENVITKYCIPEYIIMDQESAFMSSLITYLLNKFNIKIRTVAPYNIHFHFNANLYSALERLHMPHLLHFTMFPAQATFFCTVSFLLEGEPPPPRSTPWGAYRSAITSLFKLNMVLNPYQPF